jgi:tight adherence protein C
MIWTITFETFIGTLIVCIALSYALSSGESSMIRRLARVTDSPGPARTEAFAKKQKDRMQDALASLGKLVPTQGTSRAQLMLVRAGYRSPNAMMTARGLKILFPVVLVAASYLSGLYLSNPLFIFGGALLVGILLPEFWILWRISVRQTRIRRGLPDALDLLVICVEAGLGLDQAILRVSQELSLVHPDVSSELKLVTLEMRVGKTRLEALRDLYTRTGIEDIKGLVAMLAQTERFGTSIAKSLRVHSDDLRVRRRQRAEEMSAKTSVKMVPPLVLFIFPALLVVIVGPAILIIVRQLASVLR